MAADGRVFFARELEARRARRMLTSSSFDAKSASVFWNLCSASASLRILRSACLRCASVVAVCVESSGTGGACSPMGRLAAVMASPEDFNTFAREESGCDGAASLRQRAQVAALVRAWRAAKTQADQRQRAESECDAHRLAKPPPVSEFQGARPAGEQRWWKLEETDVPAKGYLEQRTMELERGDTGDATFRKSSSVKVAMPRGPEALGRRIGLGGTGVMDYVTGKVGDYVVQLWSQARRAPVSDRGCRDWGRPCPRGWGSWRVGDGCRGGRRTVWGAGLVWS